MKVNSSQLVNGLIQYADNEVINNLPTTGKWVLGAGLGIASSKVNDIVSTLNDSPLAKSLGIVDEDGMYDVGLMADHLKQSASRYGKMTIQLPVIGKLTFSEADVDSLRSYIERG